MEDHPAEHMGSAPRDGADWLPRDALDVLRTLVARYLDGDWKVPTDVQQLALEFANAARANGQTPERLLIAIRALWRDLALSQSDRLQAASVYEQLVRQAIEGYYEG